MPEREYWMVPLHESQPEDTYSRLLLKVSGQFADILTVDGGYEKIYLVTEETAPAQDDILKRVLADA
ncbi:gp057 [Rhodococcus phage ReqiPepy6]|uniref:Gp057 n=1 Tax=Rhodococcus phage ReqiPepy6 TaxID=691965 RepID=D4P7G8_9CAUD|nr:gp057 [Rhodococcus phage ReqiPepy6]ADD80948.1 gp057 [Rhodococcus phage ReqiPepy6]